MRGVIGLAAMEVFAEAADAVRADDGGALPRQQVGKMGEVGGAAVRAGRGGEEKDGFAGEHFRVLRVGVAAGPVKEVFEGGGSGAVVFGAGEDDGVVVGKKLIKGLRFFGIALFALEIEAEEGEIKVGSAAVGEAVAGKQRTNGIQQLAMDGVFAVAGVEK